MRVSKLQKAIRQKLDGMDTRQAQREAARAHMNLRQMLYIRRLEGKLGTLPEAKAQLSLLEIDITSETRRYGVVIIETKVGITMAFRPDGRLDWQKRHRAVREAMYEQEALWDSPCATSIPGGQGDASPAL